MADIKFIYFDLAGVQYNPFKGISQYVRDRGVSYINFAELVKVAEVEANKGELDVKELIHIYERILKLKMDEERFLNVWTNLFSPINEMHRFIRNLARRYRVGILSNIFPGLLNILYDKKLIADIPYSQIIQSCEVGFVKPEMEIYRIAQKRSGFYGEKILLIDDDQLYIETAKSLGWQGFVFDSKNIQESIANIREVLQLKY